MGCGRMRQSSLQPTTSPVHRALWDEKHKYTNTQIQPCQRDWCTFVIESNADFVDGISQGWAFKSCNNEWPSGSLVIHITAVHRHSSSAESLSGAEVTLVLRLVGNITISVNPSKCANVRMCANVHLVWVQMLATAWVCALTRPLLRTSRALLVGDRYSIHPTNQPKDDPWLTVRATDNTLGLQRQRMAAVNSEKGSTRYTHPILCYGAKCIFIVLNCWRWEAK